MNVQWMAPAKMDVAEIFTYYKINASEEIARKIVDGITAKAEKLSHEPRMGQVEPWLEKSDRGYRRVVEGNYKILYYIKDEKTVRIARVFDSRRDPVGMK